MPIVDVSFRLLGDVVPADHGYLLFSALSRVIPSLHGDKNVAVHPIVARPIGDRLMALTDRSTLTIRIASERISELIPLAGKGLDLDGHVATVGVPESHSLLPRANLYSRLVVIKGFMEPEPFLMAAKRQLEALNVQAQPGLVAQPQVEQSNANRAGGSHSSFLRRTVRIQDKEVVGFALKVIGLTAEESVRLQESGLGGRQHFGCGVFVPERR